MKTSSYGNIKCDIGYGGAFYAFVDVHQVNLDVSNSPCTELVKFADKVCEAVKKQYTVKHPDGDELSFLYGAILTDGKDSYSEEPTRNLCVFGDKEVSEKQSIYAQMMKNDPKICFLGHFSGLDH